MGCGSGRSQLLKRLRKLGTMCGWSGPNPVSGIALSEINQSLHESPLTVPRNNQLRDTIRVKVTRPRGPRAALEEPMERRRSRQGEEQPEQEQGMKRCGLTPVAWGRPLFIGRLTQWNPTLVLREEGMSRKCVFSRVGRKFLPQVGVWSETEEVWMGSFQRGGGLKWETISHVNTMTILLISGIVNHTLNRFISFSAFKGFIMTYV